MLHDDMHRRVTTFAVMTCFSLLATGCRKDEPAPVSEPQDPARVMAVEKCQAGLERAMKASTSEEALRLYYAECADVYSKAQCRDAWRAAASANPTEQRSAMADACRKSYCPELTSRALKMCTPDFVPSGPSLDRAWGPFFDAVLENEGAESLNPALLTLFVRLSRVKDRGDGGYSAPSASAALSASAATSASAAPSASATPHPAKQKKPKPAARH